MFPFRRRFAATRTGSVAVRLDVDERSLLREVLDQLRELLMSTASVGDVDPSMRRLYPTAYADDPDRDAEYQGLMRDQLLEARLLNLAAVDASLDDTDIHPDLVGAWMGVLNDARLVLGTRLDVSEEDPPPSFEDDHPDAMARQVYHYLGALLEELIEAASALEER